MFDSVSNKFQEIFSQVFSKGKLTEEKLSDAIRQVRLALLEADVSYKVVKKFIARVKEQALGEKLIQSVSPAQQFVKLVHDELVDIMGKQEPSLSLSQKPVKMMVCGLQGSGKTTFCGKLAKWLKKQGLNKVLLVPCDLQRPSAVEQLELLAKQVGADFQSTQGASQAKQVAQKALEAQQDYDAILFDTAGRLQVDELLMQELISLKKQVGPQEVFFVANAQTGQEAVNVADSFNQAVGVTGHVLTMLDGDTRAGAALSILEVTQKPLVFEGIGEKMGDLQLFNPHSMADRVLGMGDTVNLVKKAQEVMDEGQAKDLADKLKTASFTYDDYLSQIQMVKKMGSFKSLLKMLPGANKLPLDQFDEREFKKVEALILSMTPEERSEKAELSVSRRKRVAEGSGCKVDDINKLVKSFKQARKLFKNMPNQKKLLKAFGGNSWH